MQKRFITYCILFFLPVLVTMIALEYATRSLPTSYKKISHFYQNNKEDIEVLFLGSSQIQGGIDIQHIDIPAINFASGSQHHREDFAIYEQLKDSFPNLKYVVFELSYAHLEIPHNDKTFWKNAVYLKYYGVNAYERKTYFKDKLIYLSNPDIFSNQLDEYYIKENKNNRFNFTNYGFNKTDNGVFKKLRYDTTRIHNREFRMRNEENATIFKHNTAFLKEMIEKAINAGFHTIIADIPTYKTYNDARNPNILRRRDSVLDQIQMEFENVSVFKVENDAVKFQVTDFFNENHLNQNGAEKVSKQFNTFLHQEVLDD